MLLQPFYLGLSWETAQFLDTSLGGAFLHTCTSKRKEFYNKSLKTLRTLEFMMNFLLRILSQSPRKKNLQKLSLKPTQPQAPAAIQTLEPPMEEEISSSEIHMNSRMT